MSAPIAELLYADRVRGMHPSAIREMLKSPCKIGFGGGFPAPESFPIALIDNLRVQAESKYGARLFQYGKTEGFDPLLEVLPDFLARPNRQVVASPENILVTAGSQEALSLIGKMFLDHGSKVMVESPTYLGALQAFDAYQPRYIEAVMDKDGIIPEQLEAMLQVNPDMKFLYTIPSFQNPSGSCMTLVRRKALAGLLKKYHVLCVEDDPYSELRYDGDDLPSLQSMAPDNVIHLFTFSKTLAPDFRIGGMVAPKGIRDVAEMIKQGTSLFTSNQNQAVVAEYLAGHYIDGQIQKNCDLYRVRRDAMVQAIKDFFPPAIRANCPEGGMFLWCYLDSGLAVPAGFSIYDVHKEAGRQDVGLVTGAPFFANPESVYPSMRLNFTNQPADNITAGIRIIGNILKSKLSYLS